MRRPGAATENRPEAIDDWLWLAGRHVTEVDARIGEVQRDSGAPGARLPVERGAHSRPVGEALVSSRRWKRSDKGRLEQRHAGRRRRGSRRQDLHLAPGLLAALLGGVDERDRGTAPAEPAECVDEHRQDRIEQVVDVGPRAGAGGGRVNATRRPRSTNPGWTGGSTALSGPPSIVARARPWRRRPGGRRCGPGGSSSVPQRRQACGDGVGELLPLGRVRVGMAEPDRVAQEGRVELGRALRRPAAGWQAPAAASPDAAVARRSGAARRRCRGPRALLGPQGGRSTTSTRR